MALSASEARWALFQLIEHVNNDRSVVEIASRSGNAVLMSADDYAAWEETAHIFRSPRECASRARCLRRCACE